MPTDWITQLAPFIAQWLGQPTATLFVQYPLPLLGGCTALLLLGLYVIWRTLRRIRATWRGWRDALPMMLSARGRACLRAARIIRNSNGRLRGLIRQEIADRTEQRNLFRILDTFAQRDLEGVLRQARILITRSDDRREQHLRTRLDSQQKRWGEASSDTARTDMQEQIASTREQLARVNESHRERDRLVKRLRDAAETVLELETRLAELGAARDASVESFHKNIAHISQEIQYLRAAHKDLEKDA